MPTLPPAIAAYFVAQADRTPSAFEACFTEDAVVQDENVEYRGLEAIIAWQVQTMEKTPFTARPLSVTENGDHVIVAVEVSGAFPGSPVKLDHVFGLREGAIFSLRIG